MTRPAVSSITQATDGMLEGWRTELAALVPAVAAGSPPGARHTSGEPQRARLRLIAADIAATLGPEQLAHALAEGFGAFPLPPDALLHLLDALGRGTAAALPPAQVARLLEVLPVDWAAFDGSDLGDLFSALLLLGKAPAAASSAAPSPAAAPLPPEDAGALVGRILASNNVRIIEGDLAAAVAVLWADGFAWGPAAGRFLAAAVPPGWSRSHGAALVCRLAQFCIDSDELDLVDFEEVDRAEVDGHNPAVRIGALLDALTPVEDQTVGLAAGVVSALHRAFPHGEEGGREGDGGGGGGGGGDAPRPWQRSALFAGRVLAQLTGMQAPGSPGEWRLEDAVRLACRLCSAEGTGAGGDWRAGRSQHAYFVGDALKQVRKEWSPEAVDHLVAALQSPAYYRGSTGASAPRRIVSEVLEGLGADFTVVIGGRGAAPRQGPQGSSRVRPGTPSADAGGDWESRA